MSLSLNESQSDSQNSNVCNILYGGPVKMRSIFGFSPKIVGPKATRNCLKWKILTKTVVLHCTLEPSKVMLDENSSEIF